MGASAYYARSRPEVRPFVPMVCRGLLEIGCSEGRYMAGLKSKRGGLYAVGVEPHSVAECEAADVFDRLVHAPVEAALGGLGIHAGNLPWKIALLNQMLAGRFDDTRYQQYVCVAHRAPPTTTLQSA